MKRILYIGFLVLCVPYTAISQTFTNGDLNGTVGLPSLPTNWQDVPDTDPASLALAPVQASVDVCDALGPNQPGGIAGAPQSGATMCSGLQATDGGTSYWHEGIMQTVNGFTIGEDYSICFYQAVVKQMNCLDESGSWRVYADNTLIGTTTPSNSNLTFDDVNLQWDLVSVTFTATAASHVIKFLPWDDDANQMTDNGDITGALRMGIDNISFGVAAADPTIDPAGPFCTSDLAVNLSVDVTGGSWSGTGITDTNQGIFDPSVAGVGTHTVYYSISSGCAGNAIDSIDIDVSFGEDPSWTTLTLCISDAPVNLDNSITGATGGSWSGTGVTGTIFDPFFGTQDITYTVGSSPCLASSTQTITVVDPQLNVSETAISCNGLSDGTATVNATGVSGSETYSWNSNPIQTTPTATGLSAGSYTVTVVDGSCTVSADVIITEPSAMTGTIVGTQGCTPELGTATITLTGGTGNYTYAWNNSGSTASTANNLDSNMHVVTVTDDNGCVYEDSILIQIFPSPIVSTLSDTSVIYGECISLTANGASSYSWTPDIYLGCNNCAAPEACPLTATNYCVEGTDVNGCKASDCVLVDVEIICGDVFVPSAFSPNDDGDNDLECVYSDCMQSMTFKVYNRWGEVVFESANKNICWDGTWKGKPLNAAVFVYVLEGYLINGEQILQKGNISLVR